MLPLWTGHPRNLPAGPAPGHRCTTPVVEGGVSVTMQEDLEVSLQWHLRSRTLRERDNLSTKDTVLDPSPIAAAYNLTSEKGQPLNSQQRTEYSQRFHCIFNLPLQYFQLHLKDHEMLSPAVHINT